MSEAHPQRRNGRWRTSQADLGGMPGVAHLHPRQSLVRVPLPAPATQVYFQRNAVVPRLKLPLLTTALPRANKSYTDTNAAASSASLNSFSSCLNETAHSVKVALTPTTAEEEDINPQLASACDAAEGCLSDDLASSPATATHSEVSSQSGQEQALTDEAPLFWQPPSSKSSRAVTRPSLSTSPRRPSSLTRGPDIRPEDMGQYRQEMDWQFQQWMIKRGKKEATIALIRTQKVLKEFFQHLDTEHRGSLGVRQLEEPLVSVGLANSRDDVINLVAAADKNGSGQLGFDEFIELMSARRLPVVGSVHTAAAEERLKLAIREQDKLNSGRKSRPGTARVVQGRSRPTTTGDSAPAVAVPAAPLPTSARASTSAGVVIGTTSDTSSAPTSVEAAAPAPNADSTTVVVDDIVKQRRAAQLKAGTSLRMLRGLSSSKEINASVLGVPTLPIPTQATAATKAVLVNKPVTSRKCPRVPVPVRARRVSSVQPVSSREGKETYADAKSGGNTRVQVRMEEATVTAVAATAAGSGDDNPMAKLFRKLESGELGNDHLSFDLRIVAFRRKMLLDACLQPVGSLGQVAGQNLLETLTRISQEPISTAVDPGSGRCVSVLKVQLPVRNFSDGGSVNPRRGSMASLYNAANRVQEHERFDLRKFVQRGQAEPESQPACHQSKGQIQAQGLAQVQARCSDGLPSMPGPPCRPVQEQASAHCHAYLRRSSATSDTRKGQGQRFMPFTSPAQHQAVSPFDQNGVFSSSFIARASASEYAASLLQCSAAGMDVGGVQQRFARATEQQMEAFLQLHSKPSPTKPLKPSSTPLQPPSSPPKRRKAFSKTINAIVATTQFLSTVPPLELLSPLAQKRPQTDLQKGQEQQQHQHNQQQQQPPQHNQPQLESQGKQQQHQEATPSQPRNSSPSLVSTTVHLRINTQAYMPEPSVRPPSPRRLSGVLPVPALAPAPHTALCSPVGRTPRTSVSVLQASKKYNLVASPAPLRATAVQNSDPTPSTPTVLGRSLESPTVAFSPYYTNRDVTAQPHSPAPFLNLYLTPSNKALLRRESRAANRFASRLSFSVQIPHGGEDDAELSIDDAELVITPRRSPRQAGFQSLVRTPRSPRAAEGTAQQQQQQQQAPLARVVYAVREGRARSHSVKLQCSTGSAPSVSKPFEYGSENLLRLAVTRRNSSSRLQSSQVQAFACPEKCVSPSQHSIASGSTPAPPVGPKPTGSSMGPRRHTHAAMHFKVATALGVLVECNEPEVE